MYVAEEQGAATSCATRPYIGYPFACSSDPDYQTLARICRTLLTSPDQLLGFSAEPTEAAPEAALLRERALATLGAMDLASLRLAADILDAVARRSGDGEQPP